MTNTEDREMRLLKAAQALFDSGHNGNLYALEYNELQAAVSEYKAATAASEPQGGEVATRAVHAEFDELLKDRQPRFQHKPPATPGEPDAEEAEIEKRIEEIRTSAALAGKYGHELIGIANKLLAKLRSRGGEKP